MPVFALEQAQYVLYNTGKERGGRSMYYTGTNVALNPPTIQTNSDDPRNLLKNVGWMSAPAIARTQSGRLWMTVNLGGADEGPSNMFTVSRSDDDGVTWQEAVFAVDHPDCVRIHEPLVWGTNDGRIMVSWIQSYQWWDGRGGLWLSEIENADGDVPRMSEPVRICDGVMANPPAFEPGGRWLLPIAFWKAYRSDIVDITERQYSHIYYSDDFGRSVVPVGKADVTGRTFDEHSIVRLTDRRLMMIVRTEYGWGVSYSSDEGCTWTPGKPFRKGPSAKSCLRNLPDGSLVWAAYDTESSRRERIAVWISEDDGTTWPYRLLLDGRENVSYPNIHVCENGTIYIVHDYDRTGAKEAILHRVTIEDIKAGKLVDSNSFIGRKMLG